jgi:CBS domain-containing protein
MKVFELLTTGQRRAASIRPDAPARAAVRLLAASERSPVVVVAPDGRVMGTVTDHDVVVALACNGEPLSSLHVVDLMDPSIVCCRADDDVTDVLEAMARHRQRTIPVLEGERCVGAVSVADLVDDGAHDLDLRDPARPADRAPERAVHGS